ncbi:Exo_endo_phos domain-containing protein [Cephalotus follicularis]|uniref:Exo_endo_phos domain-containing protein n=1 Tax=Cephalotus follicularis TaxID=3775 RepID=A0A1Q3DFA2_CEPFO|nr:Exo_endo_phos domain-containing protein [Cephalotus follicularis]
MSIRISFIYGDCNRYERRKLWADIIHCASSFRNEPWIILGDFNVTRFGVEHSVSNRVTKAMQEFNNMIRSAELEDLKGSGLHFTWSNLRVGGEAISKKLDRAMGNWQWIDKLGNSFAHYHSPGISDHSPVSIQLMRHLDKGKPFKFLNFWADHVDFIKTVKEEWDKVFSGSPLMVIHKKLKSLKGPLKRLSSRLDEKAADFRRKLHLLQDQLDACLGDEGLRVLEGHVRQQLMEVIVQEEAFFKQKARIQWLKQGDSNTAYFHTMVEVRQSKNHIVRIHNEVGAWVESESDIAKVGIEYFQNLFASSGNSSIPARWDGYFKSLSPV